MKFETIKEFLEWFFQDDYSWVDDDTTAVIVRFDECAMDIYEFKEGMELSNLYQADSISGEFDTHTITLALCADNNWILTFELVEELKLGKWYKLTFPVREKQEVVEEDPNEIIEL